MKINLESIFKTLGWPVSLVAVFAAILNFFGVSLDQVTVICGTMLGAQMLVSLAVDVLKWAGVISDGTSGKWSAAFNLAVFIGIAVTVGMYPNFDFPKLDAQLAVIAQFATLLFGYIIQVVGAKRIHEFNTRVLNIRSLSFTSG